jgi:hypothetical protein
MNDNAKAIQTIYLITRFRLLERYRSYRSIVHIVEVYHLDVASYRE